MNKHFIRILITAWLATVIMITGLAGCSGPWIQAEGERATHSSLDIPLARLRAHPDEYIGMVFEDHFKFYHIYHDRQTADLENREQVIAGRTHFTARPVTQYMYVVQIQITPRQEAWLRKQGIRRQDVVKAKVRYAGLAPGEALAFELLNIE